MRAGSPASAGVSRVLSALPYSAIPGLGAWPGVVRLTEEDGQRGEMYQAQLVRGQAAARFENLEDFREDLELVRIEPAQPFSIPRIAS